MDDPLTTVSPSVSGGGPVVVAANWFRFRAGQLIRHARVDSVCFVWAVHGSGEIRAAGRSHPLRPGAVLRLPWRHDVAYYADERSPFHVGTIHLVPWHSFAHPVEPAVAHRGRDPLFSVDYRSRGEDPEHRPRLVPATSATRDFISLGTYCVERFTAQRFDEAAARALGVLIAGEDARIACSSPAREWPPALALMVDFVERHLAEPLSVADVAIAGRCSPATAQRLFGTHVGHSVLGWVRAQRMRRAAELLRNSGMRVGEVAHEVGIGDPLYFSRVFRETFGVPPSRFAVSELRP
ncbi:MAG: helix-turn-helix transcriptional regulator [Protaetiibacter sp.]